MLLRVSGWCLSSAYLKHVHDFSHIPFAQSDSVDNGFVSDIDVMFAADFLDSVLSCTDGDLLKLELCASRLQSWDDLVNLGD